MTMVPLGGVVAAVFLPDMLADTLAFANKEGAVRYWDLQTGKMAGQRGEDGTLTEIWNMSTMQEGGAEGGGDETTLPVVQYRETLLRYAKKFATPEAEEWLTTMLLQLKSSVKPDRKTKNEGGGGGGGSKADEEAAKEATKEEVSSSLGSIRAAVNSILKSVEKNEQKPPVGSQAALSPCQPSLTRQASIKQLSRTGALSKRLSRKSVSHKRHWSHNDTEDLFSMDLMTAAKPPLPPASLSLAKSPTISFASTASGASVTLPRSNSRPPQSILKTPPANDKSALSSPTRQQPALHSPASDKSALRYPASQQPALRSPASDKSALRTPGSDQSVLRTPASEQSALRTPGSDKSALSSPTSQQPALHSPASDKSALRYPASQQPALHSPASDKSALRTPASDQSALRSPANEQSAGSSQKPSGVKVCEFTSAPCEFTSAHCEFTSAHCEFTSAHCEFTSAHCEFKVYHRTGLPPTGLPLYLDYPFATLRGVREWLN
jgi:hypothetical protein